MSLKKNMILGNKNHKIFFILFLFISSYLLAEDRITTSPLVNIEEIKPSFEDLEEKNENIISKKRLKEKKNVKNIKSSQAVLIGLDKNTDNRVFKFMEKYAINLGIAFQIQDDLLDKTGAEDTLGKKVSKDADLNKITYPGLIGIQQCKFELDKCTQNAIEYISKVKLLMKNDNLELLKLLAKWNIGRDH